MLLTADSEQDMHEIGARLATAFDGGALIGLRGPLGAGKTTLVRAIVRALGVTGSVKSPTYTLVETYMIPGMSIHHFDFYRLADPGELEDIGLRDYLEPGDLCLIEWPERGAGLMPETDLDIEIEPADSTRRIRLLAKTDSGRVIVERFGEPRPSMV